MSDKHTDNETPLTGPPADQPANTDTNQTRESNKPGGGPRTEKASAALP